MTVRAAIRSMLGVVLTLIGASAGMLWAAATYGTRSAAAPQAPFATLPVFFNEHPAGVRELAAVDMRQIVGGGASGEGASRALARLGGAALPYVLPALDSLEPRSRERVALALTPVAVRMGVASADELVDGAQAVLFWTRFWQDRAIDFRTASVRHLTARLAERSIALRREDLIHVDTFALPTLIDALGEVRTTEDVARVERLSSVLAHVTERPERAAPLADVAAAQRSADAWREFWAAHGSEYFPLDGPRRLAATFVETRYGKWLAAVLRGGLGRTNSGQPALSLVRSGFAVTAGLLLVGLGGGFTLGVLWSRFERSRTAFLPRSLSLIAGTALAAVPCATFVSVLADRGTGLGVAACVVVFTTAGWVSRHLARSMLAARAQSPLTAAFSVSAPLGATYPPIVLSAIVLVELGFRLPGVGRTAALALASGDVNAWMAASLTLALVTLVLRQAVELIRPRSARREARRS